MSDASLNGHCSLAKQNKKKGKKLKKRKHKHKKDPRKSEEFKFAQGCRDISSAVHMTETFGPALPLHLQSEPEHIHQNPIIGPALPKDMTISVNSNEMGESDENDVFGPFPADNVFHTMTTAQMSLEQRALEMKLAKFKDEKSAEDETVREEWMLKLPDVGLKTGLSSLKRTFRTKERPDFSDRSCWTKTPNSSDVPSTSKVTETSKSLLDKRIQALHDEEQEKIARKLKKVRKHKESLYEAHQKKLKKEAKVKDSSGKIERRPFSRDVDLQLSKIDKNQTKTIVAKAKFLDSRFSVGSSKYL